MIKLMQPPQQRHLRALRRREQPGDEQAGAGAARPARLRRRRLPPRLPQVPRPPGEGDAPGRRRPTRQAPSEAEIPGGGAVDGHRRRRCGPAEAERRAGHNAYC
jgi:hypothetical protein